MFPVRCFTCGAVIAHKWEEYKKLIEEGKSPERSSGLPWDKEILL